MNLQAAAVYPSSGSLAKNISPPTTTLSYANKKNVNNYLTAASYPAIGSPAESSVYQKRPSNVLSTEVDFDIAEGIIKVTTGILK